MGAWGSGPHDNDTAMDFFFLLEKKPITKIVSQGLGSDDYDQVRAAAWLLQRLDRAYPVELCGPHYELAMTRLEQILADREWMSTWKDRTAIVASLRIQLTWFKKQMPRISKLG